MKSKSKVNWEIVGLILILAFAFFLRIYALGKAPLWVDESISVGISQDNIKEGGSYVLHGFMSFFMQFGNSEFFARFASVLFGLATIVLAYFMGKEYSKSGGIISALFFAIFYLEVFFSRQARYYQLFQLAFFLAIYLLYKSKDKPWMIYPAIVAYFIAIDTHLEGLILGFFFIAHILLYDRKRWFLSIIPAIPLVIRFLGALGLSTSSAGSAVNYASSYFGFARNMYYMFVLFIPGIIWGFFKNKRLTLLIILPSVFTIVGVFSLQVFAFRYVYFFMFPLVLFSALLMSFLYDKYGKFIIIPILILLLVPSNLFFAHTYVNMIKPVDYQFNDFSAPVTDYKNLPEGLKNNIINGDALLISYFSADVTYYLRKPDFVIPFSLDGRGEDQISTNEIKGPVVDRYSGAQILRNVPNQSYYLTADAFSTKKLKPNQVEFLQNLTQNCSKEYGDINLLIYYCEK
jgi:hypothetical protein